MITSIAPEASGAIGVLAALAMMGLMVVPVDLLLSGSPMHLAAGTAILVVWALVLTRVLTGQLVRVPTDPVVPGTTAEDVQRVRATRAASVLLAFLVVQALFEPDYGSALKHLTPLLPLVLIVHLFRRPA